MNTSDQLGQMLWKKEGENRVLYLRLNESEPWRYFAEFAEYILPDPPEFSIGIATFMELHRRGWQVVTEQE